MERKPVNAAAGGRLGGSARPPSIAMAFRAAGF